MIIEVVVSVVQEWGGTDSGAAGQDATYQGGEAGRQPQGSAQEMGGRRPDWLPGTHSILSHTLLLLSAHCVSNSDKYQRQRALRRTT